MTTEQTMTPDLAFQEGQTGDTALASSLRRPYSTPALTRLGGLRMDTTGTSSTLVLVDANLTYKS